MKKLILSLTFVLVSLLPTVAQACDGSRCRNITTMLDGKPHRCVVCGDVARCF